MFIQTAGIVYLQRQYVAKDRDRMYLQNGVYLPMSLHGAKHGQSMFLQSGVYLPMSLHGAKDGEGMFLQNVLYLSTSLRVAEHGDSKFLRNGAEDGKTVCSSKTMTSIYESA